MSSLGERLVWWVAKHTTNQTRACLGLAPQTASTYLKASHQIPTLYALSRYVVPPLPHHEQHIYTTGYWFLEEADVNWIAPDELNHFLEQGSPPLYFGFGSMSSSDPDNTARIIQQALEHTNQRGIIAGGWGNLKLATKNNAQIYWLDKVPHWWLFPRMAAVVHHGGAGTTAAGLRAGKPTLIVPHMNDQPHWGRRVYELGVGAKPIPRYKLNITNLSQAITVLTKDPLLQSSAAILGEKLWQEKGLEQALTLIEEVANRSKLEA